VEITYQSFEKDQPYTFPVEPYCLKVFRQRWYLLARTPHYDELRIYSLDRLHRVDVTNTPFLYPADFSPEEYFHHSFGIMHSGDDAPVTVEVKVYDNQRRYFETLPLHHSQTLLEVQAEYVLFQYLLHPTYDFIQELLSHGDNVELLKPTWLREEIAEMVQQMWGMYKS
ncbi:MAG: WYL domain-containing protein, partial [Candidatus Cloacimonetes bacterium]|nr:WYL domain-containing protein [Candidatus Cloacimonadota bacterium]